MSIAEKELIASANNVTIAENEQRVYEAGQLSVLNSAEALKGSASGRVFTINDISPIEHNVGVKVESKNLLNLDRTVGTLISGSDTSSKRTDFEFDKYYEGFVRNNFYLGSGYAFATIENGVITVNSKHAYYGIAVPFRVKSNTTYIFSGDVVGDEPYVTSSFYDKEGNYLSVVSYINNGFTTPSNATVAVLCICSQEAGGIATATNVQIEEGTTASEHTPYVEDFSGVKVKRLGKNLFNSTLLLHTPSGISTDFKYSDGYYIGPVSNLPKYYHPNFDGFFECALVDGCFKEKTQYTLSFHGYTNRTDNNSSIGFFFEYTDGSSHSKYLQTDSTEVHFVHTSTAGKTVKAVYVGYGYNATVYIRDMQLEEGAIPTKHEPYQPTEYTPNADGTVEGVTSLYPSMTLLTDVENVNITANYYKDIDKVFENLAINVALTGGE